MVGWPFTALYDGSAKIWCAASWECLQTLSEHSKPLKTAEFSRDGERVVTASDDGLVKIWSCASGECLVTIMGHTSEHYLPFRVTSAVFSPDGEWVLTASRDRTAKI